MPTSQKAVLQARGLHKLSTQQGSRDRITTDLHTCCWQLMLCWVGHIAVPGINFLFRQQAGSDVAWRGAARCGVAACTAGGRGRRGRRSSGSDAAHRGQPAADAGRVHARHAAGKCWHGLTTQSWWWPPVADIPCISSSCPCCTSISSILHTEALPFSNVRHWLQTSVSIPAQLSHAAEQVKHLGRLCAGLQRRCVSSGAGVAAAAGRLGFCDTCAAGCRPERRLCGCNSPQVRSLGTHLPQTVGGTETAHPLLKRFLIIRHQPGACCFHEHDVPANETLPCQQLAQWLGRIGHCTCGAAGSAWRAASGAAVGVHSR